MKSHYKLAVWLLGRFGDQIITKLAIMMLFFVVCARGFKKSISRMAQIAAFITIGSIMLLPTTSFAVDANIDVVDAGTGPTEGGGSSKTTCTGAFANPITGMCWSCVMPIGISSIFFKGNQDGTKDLSGWRRYVCTCDLYVGVPISYYEPARIIDVTTKPYCMVGLGGVKFGNTGLFDFDSAGIVQEQYDTEKMHVFQAHYYINPVMYIIGQALDNSKCFEQSGFDVAYITEVDPSWLNAEFANLLSPDSFLYATMPAVVACTGDCIASTVNFGLAAMHWCVGCNGLMYPMTGVIDDNSSTIESSGVIMLRLLNKLHRQGINLSYYGNNGLCGGYRQILMNKRQYKYSMQYPVSQTKSVVQGMQTALNGASGGGSIGETVTDSADFVGTNNKTGKQCCQPFGRSTFIWGSGRYYPIKGEDMSFQIYRKRDCCQAVLGVP